MPAIAHASGLQTSPSVMSGFLTGGHTVFTLSCMRDGGRGKKILLLFQCLSPLREETKACEGLSQGSAYLPLGPPLPFSAVVPHVSWTGDSRV